MTRADIAMVEMGRCTCTCNLYMHIPSLRSSQQKIAEIKPVSDMMKESVWVDDREATDCQQCNKPFSVARRKVCLSVCHNL